jgi:hypothetical protein
MAGSSRDTATRNSAPETSALENPGRRGFFKAAATGAAGAAVAAPVLLAGGTVRAQQSTEEKTKSRYQETEHVRTFYETNRY